AMGIGWNSTLYGGLMTSDIYHAGALGISRDMGQLGALAFDLTHSRADTDRLDESSVQGMSYAIKYGKAFATDSSLRFAGYRYSTEGYRDSDEAVRQRDQSNTFSGSRRSRLEASIHQRIGSRSSLGMTLSQQDYWG
ncbi:fimbria/pilus outer membrane usher protein, partial [Pseudomonas viridiflava]|uniref:fimbria/pilus outer membrane usher protein n=1 Tax=Pseudomonas viridiflava TaxID=33069 RepID=UPI0013CEAF90